MISEVQQAEEPAPEAESERHRGLGLEMERGVVQPELLERVAKLRVFVPFHRIEPGEDHRLELAEPGERDHGRPRRLGDGVPDLRVGHPLDARRDPADVADAQLVDRLRLGSEHPHFLQLVLLALRHQAHPHTGPERSVDDAHDDDHAAVRVVGRVEDERLERRLGVALRRRDPGDDRLEHLAGAGAGLRAGQQGVARVEADDVLDLPAGLLGLRPGQIDLVDDRQNGEVVVIDGEVGVGQRLRLDALRGIHQQQGPFAGRQRPRHFVREVDMAGRVDQVQDVGLAVIGQVGEPDRVGLDGDAALPLEVHRVEDLRLHLARLHRAGQFEKPVGERRLAVVDVGDDREVADETLVHAEESPATGARYLPPATWVFSTTWPPPYCCTTDTTPM